jgi:hypothetical protein
MPVVALGNGGYATPRQRVTERIELDDLPGHVVNPFLPENTCIKIKAVVWCRPS